MSWPKRCVVTRSQATTLPWFFAPAHCWLALPIKQTLALLPMTLDTYGLAEDEYLAIFKEKAEFACKALRIVEHVASDYNIKMEPKLFWDLYQEIGYATDDACRIKQKKEDPEALEERSYTSNYLPHN
jgi:hypothetical protein